MEDQDFIRISNQLAVRRSDLQSLARRAHVRRIALFGSAARDELRSDSDIDLLLEFKPGEAPSLGGLVRLRDEFSALFGGRRVDLVTRSILDNPYRRKAIEQEARELYAA